MLLSGTSHDLRVLESGTALVDGVAVTALVGCGTTRCVALLDRRSVVLVDTDEGEAVRVGELPEADGQSLAVLPNRTIVVGRSGGRLAIVETSGEVRDVPAFQSVPGREGWENPAAPTPDTRTMAVGGERWWVNVHVGGLWWSDDTGRTWHRAVDPKADVHEVRSGPNGEVAVAAAVGFGWSEDNGTTWAWTTEGLHASYLRAAALDGDTAFVSASDGPFTRNGALYRARLGSSFERCEKGLPERFDANIDSGRVDARGGRVAFGFGAQLYLSEDNGGTWHDTVVGDDVTTVRFTAD